MQNLDIYLTKDNLEAIERELKKLQTVDLPKAIEEVTIARGHGDLSENFEFIAARTELQNLNKRITELQRVIAFAQTVTKIDTDTIDVGTQFIATTIRNGVVETKLYELVGYVDLNKITAVIEDSSKPRVITVGSPFGKAIRGKQAGEAYSYVDVDNNKVTGEIVTIMSELDINMTAAMQKTK